MSISTCYIKYKIPFVVENFNEIISTTNTKTIGEFTVSRTGKEYILKFNTDIIVISLSPQPGIYNFLGNFLCYYEHNQSITRMVDFPNIYTIDVFEGYSTDYFQLCTLHNYDIEYLKIFYELIKILQYNNISTIEISRGH